MTNDYIKRWAGLVNEDVNMRMSEDGPSDNMTADRKSLEAKVEEAKDEVSEILKQIGDAYNSVSTGIVLLERYVDKRGDDKDLDAWKLNAIRRDLENIFQGEDLDGFKSIFEIAEAVRDYRKTLENFDYDSRFEDDEDDEDD